MLSTPLSDGYMTQHPASIGMPFDIAFHVGDADLAFHEAVKRGAASLEEPHDEYDEFGRIRRAAIHTYGDTIHSLISPIDYKGPFLPRYQAAELPGREAGILRIDHIVGNVELGKMNEWADFYSRVCGFHRYINFDDKDISTEYSALMSIVMSDDSQSVKFPINEPAAGRRKSQIQEYLDYNHGPGVQHIALQTKNIIQTVSTLKSNGVEFVEVPDTYYEQLPSRVGEIAEDLGSASSVFWSTAMKKVTCCSSSANLSRTANAILRNHSACGKPRFWQREFQGTFEAIEAEQARRGNL